MQEKASKQNNIFWLAAMLTSFLLNACLPASTQTQVLETPVGTPAPTMTLTPTATVDILPTTIVKLQVEAQQARESARLAQLTSDAANRLLVDATVTHEAILYAYSIQTVTAEQVALQYSEMTQQAGFASATAYATAFPATQTAQTKSDLIKTTAMAMTINAPAQLRAMSAAQAAAEYSWVEPFSISVITVSVFVLVIILLIYVSRIAKSTVTSDSNKSHDLDLLPIPMATKPSEPNTTLRANIPCTWPRLELLAIGIIRGGKTLAINQWEKTIVHRSINDLRQYFREHEFAYELPGKSGELALREAGNHFLMYCVENGEPPLPHVCQKIASPTA